MPTADTALPLLWGETTTLWVFIQAPLIRGSDGLLEHEHGFGDPWGPRSTRPLSPCRCGASISRFRPDFACRFCFPPSPGVRRGCGCCRAVTVVVGRGGEGARRTPLACVACHLCVSYAACVCRTLGERVSRCWCQLYASHPSPPLARGRRPVSRAARARRAPVTPLVHATLPPSLSTRGTRRHASQHAGCCVSPDACTPFPALAGSCLRRRGRIRSRVIPSPSWCWISVRGVAVSRPTARWHLA